MIVRDKLFDDKLSSGYKGFTQDKEGNVTGTHFLDIEASLVV